jgi:hypothetical protein
VFSGFSSDLRVEQKAECIIFATLWGPYLVHYQISFIGKGKIEGNLRLWNIKYLKSALGVYLGPGGIAGREHNSDRLCSYR